MSNYRTAFVADYEGRERRPHSITIANTGPGFDWWCTCHLISEGQWSGDDWPTVEVAEKDAVRVHDAEDDPINPWEAPA